MSTGIPEPANNTEGQSKQPPQETLDEFTMLTFLLRLAAILRHGEASLHGYAENDAITNSGVPLDSEADLRPLEAISAILVQEHEVIAACYQSTDSLNLTVMSNSSARDDSEPADNSSSGAPDDVDVREQYLEFPINSEKSTMPLNVTALANPDRKTNSLSQEGCIRHNLRVVSEGHDYWPDIKREPLCFIGKSPIPLQDHAKTVCSYLNEYRTLSNSERTEYSRKFFQYLLSVCWRKLHRRVKSWQGLAFMYGLYRYWNHVDYDAVDWPSDSELNANDRTLAALLGNNKPIVETLKDACNPSEHVSFDALMSAVKSGGAIYTKETAKEFHDLLRLTFVKFGVWLRLFDDESSAANGEGKALLKCFGMLEIYTRLLLCIFTSHSFKAHIRACTMEGAELNSMLSDYRKRDRLRSFAQSIGIVPKDGETSKDGKTSNDGSDCSSEPEDDDDFDEALELPEGVKLDNFFAWVKVFVFQFLAKRQLEVRCLQKPPTPVTISILAVDREAYRVPSWDNFKEVIETAINSVGQSQCSSSALQSDQVFEALEGGLSRYHSQSQRTIEMFRRLVNKQATTFTAGTHCEAVLATLSYALTNLKRKEHDLFNVCKTLNDSLISVSKLCCPVCWELLSAMEGGTQKPLIARGCHSTIYPVVLPKWLPTVIYNKMIHKFRTLLRDELCQLVRPPVRHTHRPKQESEANISVGSSQGKGATFEVDLEYIRSQEARVRARIP